MRSLYKVYSWILQHSVASRNIFSLITEKIKICSSSLSMPSRPSSKTSMNSLGFCSLKRSWIWEAHLSKSNLMFVSFKIPSFLKSALRIAYHISLHLRAAPSIGLASEISLLTLCLGMLARDEKVFAVWVAPLPEATPVAFAPVLFIYSIQI